MFIFLLNPFKTLDCFYFEFKSQPGVAIKVLLLKKAFSLDLFEFTPYIIGTILSKKMSKVEVWIKIYIR